MSASALLGVGLTLAMVLGLVTMTMRLLRRVTQGTGAVRGAQSLQVVQRIPLGPRQGIAVVRIGGQTLAVSVGEGGVRTLAELDDVPEKAPAAEPVAAGPRRDFTQALRQGLRAAGLPLAVLLMMAGAALPSRAGAQGTAAPSAAATAPGTTPRSTSQAPAAPGASLDALTRALPQIDLKLNGDTGAGGLRLSGTVGVIVMMGLLTLLPTLLLLMTSFTRIIIVLHFLKQALGTQTAPPAHLISAMALLLTGFVMSPTLSEVNRTALAPWLDGKMDQAQMIQAAVVPMRGFMLRQTRERDLEAFVEMSSGPAPDRPEDVSTVVLMSAFVTSELRTAFQLGFVLFLPFIIIDVVVASVLMSMGMFMLPPAMISLPFKLLLFVLVDGWSLLVQSLVAGFR